jgi:hypothetical protein
MNDIDAKELAVRQLIAEMKFETFEEALDVMLRNHVGQLFSHHLYGGHGDLPVRRALLTVKTGSYLPLLTHDEIRDLRKRNYMSPETPDQLVTGFMPHVEASLQRTGLGYLLGELDIKLVIKRDRTHKNQHILLVPDDPRY